MNRNDLCWCGSGLKYKKCHLAFDEKLDGMKFDFFKGQVRPPHKIIKNAADIEGIRKAGVINDAALDLAGSMVREGIDTESIDGKYYGIFRNICNFSLNKCYHVSAHLSLTVV